MKRREFPILEFDSTRRAVIEPSEQIRASGVPGHCVPCFFGDVSGSEWDHREWHRRTTIRENLGDAPPRLSGDLWYVLAAFVGSVAPLSLRMILRFRRR